MDARLTWNRNRRRRGDDSICAPHRGYSLVFYLVFLVFLIGFYVLVSWDNVRCLNQFDHSSESPVPSSTKSKLEERLQDRIAPFILVTAVVVMISILHVVFKIPCFGTSCTVPAAKRSPDTKNTVSKFGGHGRHPGACKHVEENEEGLLPRPNAPFCDIKLDTLTNTNDFTNTTDDEIDKYSITEDIQLKNEDSVLMTQTPTQVDSDKQTTKEYGNSVTAKELGEPMVMVPNLGDYIADTDSRRAHDFCTVVREDAAAQTDETSMSNVATNTCSPEVVDVSVNTHQKLFKVVRNYGTTTSGPFMKKLRRAQRLLKEAKAKARQEKQDKVVRWRAVIDRYRDRLLSLSENLEKKDRLLGCTVLNRFLTENDVKDMCTAVRCHTSARDRLQTQIKLNSALRDVVESKRDIGTGSTTSSTGRQTNQASCR